MTDSFPTQLLDECCDAALVARLQAEGIDLAYIAETDPGLNDRRVLARASAEGRILLTEDKDFGDLADRRRQATSGVVLIWIAPHDRKLVADRMFKLLRDHGPRLAHSYAVVQADKFRFRRLG